MNTPTLSRQRRLVRTYLQRVRTLALVVVALTTTTTLLADDLVPRPLRGRQRKYTSPEAIQAREDSLAMAAGDSIPVDSLRLDTPSDTPRRNTLQQIDSVVALWRSSTTVERYERYFEEIVMASREIDSTIVGDNLDSLYIARLGALMSPVPMTYNPEVRSAIERFTSPAYSDIMSYAYYYFPIIEEEFINAGIPIEIRTLAVVESGLNALAVSRSNAKGLWQFMPSTGRDYGLEINSLVDERCNPRKASAAAARYLRSMYNCYGDWTLAIASYNCGPGRVNRAIVRAGGDPRNYEGSFWDIYQWLPSETRSYVPLYMGATYAFAYHRAHGIEYPTPPMPLSVDTITIERPMHLEQVATVLGIDLETLKMLNPEYIMSIIPATTRTYPLTLPTEYVTEYYLHEADIHALDTTYLKEYAVDANLERLRQQPPPATYHTVSRGETLGGIANRYGRTVRQLMNWNNISNPNSLRIGQRLRVSP